MSGGRGLPPPISQSISQHTPLTRALHNHTHPQQLITHPRPQQHPQQQLTSDIETTTAPRTDRNRNRTQHTIQTETALSITSNYPRPTRKHGSPTTPNTTENYPQIRANQHTRISNSHHRMSPQTGTLKQEARGHDPKRLTTGSPQQFIHPSGVRELQ